MSANLLLPQHPRQINGTKKSILSRYLYFYSQCNYMTDIEIIDLTPENIADYGVCGYKDVEKQ
jgi:hypothetical protein